MADGIYTELAGATKPDASTASDESLIPHDTLPVPVEDVPVTETEISPSRIPPEMLAARQFESLVHKAFLLLSGLSVVCLLVLALVIYCLVTRQDTYDLIVTGNVKDLSGLSIFTGSGSWCSKKDLPDARADFQAVAVNGSIYILGGVGTRRDVLNSTLRYNPVYQRYRYLALMPEPRYRYGAAHLDGRIYVVGGYNTAEDALPQQCMLVYTIASNSWEWGACTNDYHSDTCAVAINGKVYVVGGYGAHYAISDVVEEYDPATARWQRIAPLPTPRGDLACVALGGRMYAVGGYYDPLGTWGATSFRNEVEVYDPAKKKWSTAAPMLVARGDKALVALDDNRMLAIGGETNGVAALIPTHHVELYYADLDRWVPKAPMGTARFRFGAAFVNGQVIAFGGAQVCEQHCDDQACHDDCSEQGMKSVEEFLDTMSQDVFLVKGGPLDRGRMR